MKTIRTVKFFLIVSIMFLGVGCNFLEPLPDGSYNDENFELYPELVRGFVDKVYNDFLPNTYYSDYYIALSGATDDAVFRSETAAMRLFSNGSSNMSNNPFVTLWARNYAAINYLNMFIKDDKGFNTKYMINNEADQALRNSIQGDAYGLRAWLLYDLLRVFGGQAEDGEMLGVPIITAPSDIRTMDPSTVKRNTFDECVAQILGDCEVAYNYLHMNNRDYPDDPEQVIIVTGSARYKTLDKVAIDALRAMVYILWASPAFNPAGDMSRYENAARYAAKVMKHKLEVESTLQGGFNPHSRFLWSDGNSPEIIWLSDIPTGAVFETNLYPLEFGGSANIAPTQELIDAFPMKNGYPVTDVRSGYDPANPYDNRDPRFYSTVFYNGAKVQRNTNSEVMYTFESSEGGKDAPGGVQVSPTSYYIKKFIFTGWNPNDNNVQTASRPIFFMRWTQMCLIFAEAANRTVGPIDQETYGYSAKQALGWLRARQTNDGENGLGFSQDPFLNECAAAGKDLFEELVKNEWRLETCFEGTRFFNLRRWSKDVSTLNQSLHMARIKNNGDGTYSYDYSQVVAKLNFPSVWIPIPYSELRKSPGLLQNKGWESWK